LQQYNTTTTCKSTKRGDSVEYLKTFISALRNNTRADAAFLIASVTPTNVLSNNGQIWGTWGVVPVGTDVHMLGGVSGLRSGTVTNIQFSYTSTNDGMTRLNQSRASYSSQGGDSGSPILFFDGNFGSISRYNIVGIHVGSGGTFSKYSEISSALSVTAITN